MNTKCWWRISQSKWAAMQHNSPVCNDTSVVSQWEASYQVTWPLSTNQSPALWVGHALATWYWTMPRKEVSNFIIMTPFSGQLLFAPCLFSVYASSNHSIRNSSRLTKCFIFCKTTKCIKNCFRKSSPTQNSFLNFQKDLETFEQSTPSWNFRTQYFSYFFNPFL